MRFYLYTTNLPGYTLVIEAVNSEGSPIMCFHSWVAFISWYATKLNNSIEDISLSIVACGYIWRG